MRNEQGPARRRQQPWTSRRLESGFTLLELLVVVSVLAALAGLTAVRVDSYEGDAQLKLAQVEMDRIASAIQRFRADTGYYPNTGPFAPNAMQRPSAAELVNEENGWGNDGRVWLEETWFSPASFAWLFTEPTWPPVPTQVANALFQPSALMPWNMDAARGWHGPYLEPSSQSALIRRGLSPAGGDPCRPRRGQDDQVVATAGTGDYPVSNLIAGITDPFEKEAARRPAGAFCRVTNDPDHGGYVRKRYGGSPYLYETDFWNAEHQECSSADRACVVLRSFGPNSKDEGGSGDDLVLVLEKHA